MRYLNDKGIDTDLLIFNDAKGHGDPVNDTYDYEYFDKIINTKWKDKGLIWLSQKDINAYLDRYDFVIGSDYSPALFYRIRRKLDIFFPHGTDLFNYPFKKIGFQKNVKKTVGEWIMSRWQYKGIQSFTNTFLFELTNNENEGYVKRLTPASFQRQYLTVPSIYIPQYVSEAIEKFSEGSQNVQLLADLKRKGYTIVFHHCQQQWANPVHSLFYKGNDKLIRGFANFVKEYPLKKLRLVMVERGTDVQLSKKLISELGIDDHVIWFSFMPRKEIMACLHYVDIGIGELGHSWYTYSVVSEFMTRGVPIVHTCDREYYRTIHEDIYPMYTASSASDITRVLEEYFENPEAFRNTGASCKEWYGKNILAPFFDFLTAKLKQVN